MKHYFKKISLILVLTLVLSVITPFATVFADNKTQIIIAHTNDTHARVFEDEYDGMGFAKISAKVKQLKKENPNTLLVDAGDMLHGLPIATLSRGESIVKLMNAMGYDVMVPGNHDFNYGFDRLLQLSKMMNFPLIAANVQKNGENVFKSYIIKEIDGIKFAFFGLVTPETAYKTNPNNIKDLDFLDPIKVSKEIVERLKGKVDFIIAVSHLGLDKDSRYTSEKVAQEVDGINLIIDGHSHTALPKGQKIGETLIVQTGEHTKNLGIVEIEFEDKKPISTQASLFTKEEATKLQADEEITKLISDIEEDNKKITSIKVGKTSVKLDGEREHVRTRESNLGNLITDAIIKASNADISIVNGGDIRASLEPGDITIGDIIKVLPFANYLVVKEISGKDIIAALEHGTSSYPEPSGGFPQVGGMSYKIDLSKPIGNRITDVKVNGKPIELDKTYKLGINDFLAAGGDGYEMFPKCKTVLELPSLNELVIDYIKEIGTIDIEEEGRITIINDQQTALEIKPEPKVKSKPKTIPVEKPAAAVTQKEKTYIVKPGDVLWKIAKKFGVSWKILSDYNNLKNPHLIFPGQKILIPTN